MPTSNELHVPIDDTHMLCASIATDENNQPGIIVYIKDKDGNVTQDISANHVLDTIHIRHLLYRDIISRRMVRRLDTRIHHPNLRKEERIL